MRSCCVSLTISSGGFSSASRYSSNWRIGLVEVAVRPLELDGEVALEPDIGTALAAGGSW